MARDELTEIPSFAARRDEAVDSAPRNAYTRAEVAMARVRVGPAKCW
jgi:hypothetical protein